MYYQDPQVTKKRRIIAIIAIIVIIFVALLLFTVKKIITLEDIIIKEKQVDLDLGESYTIEYELSPSSVPNQELVWSTDNTNAISLDNGTVTGINAGAANVWVSSKKYPNIRKKIYITVASRKRRFSQRLEREFGYQRKDANVFAYQGDQYVFDFNNNYLSSQDNGLDYYYYYKENYILGIDGYGSHISAEYRYDIGTGHYSCNGDCKNIPMPTAAMLDLMNKLKEYLGAEFTLDDL